jgi:hypothetical protein
MALNPRATIQELYPGVDLCRLQAGQSPDGQPPNFVDPPTLQPAVIATATVMLALAFFILAGRLFVNRKSMKPSDCVFTFIVFSRSLGIVTDESLGMMVVGFIFDVGLVGSQIARMVCTLLLLHTLPKSRF